MRKTLAFETARGVFFYTDILDKNKNAAFISQVYSSGGPGSEKEVQVLYVKDKDQNPINVLKTISYPEDDIESIAQARTEFELAKRLGLGHTNIAKGLEMKQVWLDQTCLTEMLMEYGGENLLVQNKKVPFTGVQLINIAMHTASAMEFAHKQGVFHSDLKPENIVYKDGVAKIIDFGVSLDLKRETVLKNYTKSVTNNVVGGTPIYSPPELLKREKIQLVKEALKEYGKGKAVDEAVQNEILQTIGGFRRDKIDVYLWGMTFYHLASGKSTDVLGEEREKYTKSQEVYENFKAEIKQLKLGGDINNSAKSRFIEMLDKCLSYSVVDRPSFTEINSSYLFKIKEIIGTGVGIGTKVKNEEEEKKKPIAKGK